MLQLELVHGGKLLDKYVNHPDYFGKLSKKRRAALAGNPELWAPVLDAEHDPEDLADALGTDDDFAEETLFKLEVQLA